MSDQEIQNLVTKINLDLYSFISLTTIFGVIAQSIDYSYCTDNWLSNGAVELKNKKRRPIT